MLHLATLTGDYKHATNFPGYGTGPFKGSSRVDFIPLLDRGSGASSQKMH
jgi:hypothetical protein